MPNPAVLLIHGFTSHRSSLDAVIPALDQRGLPWHYPILAGHGTSPKDLADKRWSNWQADVESGYGFLRQNSDQVVIVALSMGALLGLELAASHPKHVAGLVLVAPCLRFKSKLSRYTPIVSRVMSRFPNASLPKFSSITYARRDHGYLWFPTSAYRSYWERTHEMEPIIRAVTQPVRIIQSRRDLIADPRGAQEIFDLLPGQKELLWHERSGHEMLLDCETENVIQEILTFQPLNAAYA